MIIRSTIAGSNRVLRGGSWNNNARNCRVTNRNNNSPDNRNNNNGFRLVLVPARRHSRIAATEQIVVPFHLYMDKYQFNPSPASNANESRAGF
jgi:hypothetical protein